MNPTRMARPVAELFGISDSRMSFPCGERPLAPADHGIAVNNAYVWRKNPARDMLVFWVSGTRSMMLHGPKGCGKTSLVEQFHARTNLGLICMGGHKRLSSEDLFGQYLPNASGGLDWHDGPVTTAARSGLSVLINEFNAIDPGVSILLNDIAQSGSVVTVPQTGEVIQPHVDFRIFATQNPAGTMYSRQQVDPSTRERFYHLVMDFPSAADEMKILVPIFQRFGTSEDNAKAHAARVIQVAEAVRRTSMEVSDAPDALPETISTRVLCAWATYWCMMTRRPHAVHRGLERALTYSCEPEVRRTIHAHVQRVFGGEDYTQTLAEA